MLIKTLFQFLSILIDRRISTFSLVSLQLVYFYLLENILRREEIPGFDKSSLLERFSSQTDHRLDRMRCQLEGFLVWEILWDLIKNRTLKQCGNDLMRGLWVEALKLCSHQHISSSSALPVNQHYTDLREKYSFIFWNTKLSNKIAHLFYIRTSLKKQLEPVITLRPHQQSGEGGTLEKITILESTQHSTLVCLQNLNNANWSIFEKYFSLFYFCIPP